MKKSTLLFTALFISVFSFAQIIPNAGFETWINNNETSTTYLVPQHWISSDVFLTELNTAFGNPNYSVHSVSQAGSAHGGLYAVQMSVAVSNAGDTVGGAIYSLDSAAVLLANAFGSGKMSGFPYAARSANLTGYYKFNRAGGDSAAVEVFMTKWNTSSQHRDTLGRESYYITANAAAWTMFSVPVTYAYNENPDTVIIGAGVVSNATPHIGTLFTIDDLAFTGLVPMGVNEHPANTAIVTLSPNPFTEQTTLNETNMQLKNATLEIYDVLGNKVRVMNNLSGNSITIDRDGLTTGIYFYSLINDNTVVATGKMSVE